MQAFGESVTQSSARPAGSPTFSNFSSASVEFLRDSSTDSFELPAAPSDHRGFGSAEFSRSLARSQFLIPEASFSWTHQDWQPSWQPGPRESVSRPFAGLAAPGKQSPVEAGKERSTPSCTPCKAALAGMPLQQSPEVLRGNPATQAALVTTGSSMITPHKRTVKTVEERKAHRLAKNRAPAASSKRKREAAQKVQQQHGLHELFGAGMRGAT
ncbi:hypothetical protein WJX73_004848 [Symbiochloris irregularis]|uniref:BZIP domain-containing protein n=1 Tax=Symbiochloris irregularis TaxID=706552 RepID=A0AAW1P0L3_9CHLO